MIQKLVIIVLLSLSYSANLSTELSAYYFSSITLDGEALSLSDEILAYNNSTGVMVGHGNYGNAGNGQTEIIVYGEISIEGSDSTFNTAGYMLPGEIPQFYVNNIKANYITSNGVVLQIIPPFNSPSIHTGLTLDLVSDCNGDMGGAAVISGICADCWGGYSNLEEDFMDTDSDGICNYGAENGDSDNCPNIENNDQLDYDNDNQGDACDPDDDNDNALDENDSDDNNANICSDDDEDSCDDCTNGLYNVFDDGWDYDGDGSCDAGDPDDDNDGALDDVDIYDNYEYLCSDDDDDTCDDCSSGTYDIINDGYDNDLDGICDTGDDDDDNDGCIDDVDDEPFTWDDDYDSDGIPDDCDTDDDNDGLLGCDVLAAGGDEDDEGINYNCDEPVWDECPTENDCVEISNNNEECECECIAWSSDSEVASQCGVENLCDIMCGEGGWMVDAICECDCYSDSDNSDGHGDSGPPDCVLDCEFFAMSPEDYEDYEYEEVDEYACIQNCNLESEFEAAWETDDADTQCYPYSLLLNNSCLDSCDGATASLLNDIASSCAECLADDAIDCSDIQEEYDEGDDEEDESEGSDNDDDNALDATDNELECIQSCNLESEFELAMEIDDADAYCSVWSLFLNNSCLDSCHPTIASYFNDLASLCYECLGDETIDCSDMQDSDDDGDEQENEETQMCGASLNWEDSGCLEDCTDEELNGQFLSIVLQLCPVCYQNNNCETFGEQCDLDDNDPLVCSDMDGDICNDCYSGQYDPANDGPDNDNDGLCDPGDPDDDNDGCEDSIDKEEDGSDASFTWDDDYDEDGTPDDCDDDADNDGSQQDIDSDDNNEFICSDDDGDSCDDCTNGLYNVYDDGWDYDGDGACDLTDADDDNDGALDELDSDDNNEFICSDDDGDTCDDCSGGNYKLDSDGDDNDDDGWCNDGDPYPDCAFDNANDSSVYPEGIESNPYDECGNCHGDAFYDNCIGTDECDDMACDGDCDQVAYIDDCNVCDDISFNDCTSYYINLDGVDLISFYGLLEDNSIENIFDALIDNRPSILAESGSAIYYNNEWLGSLKEIDKYSGYWVLVDGNSSLYIEESIPTDPNTQYTLSPYTNLISYPFKKSAAIENVIPQYALSSIDAIIGEGSAAINSNGNFVGGLTTFDATEGYWIITSSDITFSYIPPEGNLARNISPIREVIGEYSYAQSSKQAFYFIEEATIDGIPIEIADLIIAYNKDVIVGSRYWYGYMTDVPAMGSDGLDTQIGYCNNNDQVDFKILDSSTGNLIDMYTSVETNWENLGISIIRLSNNRSVSKEISFKPAYPNPFNPITTLHFSLPKEMYLEIRIYDMNGRLISEITKDIFSIGEHSISWDASLHASGIYIVNMLIGEEIYSQKIMLIK